MELHAQLPIAAARLMPMPRPVLSLLCGEVQTVHAVFITDRLGIEKSSLTIVVELTGQRV